MKLRTLFLLTAMAVSSIAFCHENQDSISPESNPHRIYGGIDLFGSFNKSRYSSRTTIQSGLRIGYDYVKPDAFYFGGNGLFAPGAGSDREKYYINPFGDTVVEKSPFRTTFSNLETRFGYTFGSDVARASTISPFVGLGWFYQDLKTRIWDCLDRNWMYSALGFQANHQFSRTFDLGLGLKATGVIVGNFPLPWSNILGYEAAFPLTWHLGAAKKWDIQIQPYFLKLGPTPETYVGARFLSGYSF